MSSYNVFLPLGRTYLQNKQKQKALKALKYFIEHCEAELAGEENPEWLPPEEGKTALKKELEFARWLVTLCKEM